MSDGEISAAVWLYGAGERQAEYKRTLIMRRLTILYQSPKKTPNETERKEENGTANAKKKKKKKNGKSTTARDTKI